MAKNKVNSEGMVLEIPIKFSMITKIEYEQKFGEHAEMEIHGILDADKKVKQVYALNMEDAILLKQKDKILFSGVPSCVSVSHEGNLTKVMVKGHSRSILLDLERKKRSFQKKQSYKALMENVLGNEGLLFLQKGLSEKQKEQMVMQYKETDWEFIKRMASHLHAPICPNIGIEKTGIYVGYPKGKELEESVSVFKMKKDISEYLRYREQNSSATDKEFITMTIRSLERYAIGDTLSYEGYEFMVCSVQMKYEDGRGRWDRIS